MSGENEVEGGEKIEVNVPKGANEDGEGEMDSFLNAEELLKEEEERGGIDVHDELAHLLHHAEDLSKINPDMLPDFLKPIAVGGEERENNPFIEYNERAERDNSIYRFNGETPAQMKYAQVVKDRKTDDTVDSDWPWANKFTCADIYVCATGLPWIVIKILVFFFPLYLATLPFFCMLWCWCQIFLPRGNLDRIGRKTCGFQCLFWMIFMPFGAPFLILMRWIITYIIDNIWYYIWGGIFFSV